MRRIILGIAIVLTFLSVSCKDKDDDHPTKPRVDYTALAFKNLVSGKTFTMQVGMSSEFGDATGAITFDNNALPVYLAITNDMGTADSLSSVKLYRTPATNKGIYSVLASNVILATDGIDNILGNIEMYVGIEITSSGTVLYETSIKGIVGSSTISSSDIDWNKCFISGFRSDNPNITVAELRWFPPELIGTWLPKIPYTNEGFFDGEPYAYVEYPFLRILSDATDSNDIVFYTYSGNTFSPAYSDAVDEANTYDGNFGYKIIDDETHLFKLGDNEYIMTISFQDSSDSDNRKTRIYDIIYLNETSIKIMNAKNREYGVIYQDLIFEKVTTP